MFNSLATLTPGVFYQFIVSEKKTIQFTKVSNRFEELTGISTAELLHDANSLLQYIKEPVRENLIQSVIDSSEKETELDFCIELYTPRGDEVFLEARSSPTIKTNGSVVWNGFAYDVTAREVALRKLEKNSELLSSILDNMLDAVINIDRAGTIIYVNRTASFIFGYKKKEILGKNVNILMGNYHAAHHDSYLKNHQATHENRVIGKYRTLEAKHKDNTIIPIELRVCNFDNNNVISYLGIIRDLRYKSIQQQDLDKLKLSDQLTGLSNRTSLVNTLNECIDVLVFKEKQFCLVCFDADDFRFINEGYGYDYGDEFLRQLARSLKSSDGFYFCSRPGEDEFAVVLESNYDNRGTENFIDIILRRLSAPHTVFDVKIRCTFSAGAYYFDSSNTTSNDIIRKTELALSYAKANVRGSCKFHGLQMDDDKRKTALLDQCLKDDSTINEFYLVYQPQYDSNSHLFGFEALMRWKHNEQMISPDVFIPIAERNGSIYKLGNFLLKNACRFIQATENYTILANCRVSINISPLQFSDPNFVNLVLKSIFTSNIDPRRLHLELTERLLLESAVDVASKMKELRDIGLTFSLDDFGTGYSSLSYLKQLPLQELKIDKSFINDLHANESDRSIVDAILRMAEGLNLEVIAEGVETELDKNVLMQMGCRKFQGYLFGKPQEQEYWFSSSSLTWDI